MAIRYMFQNSKFFKFNIAWYTHVGIGAISRYPAKSRTQAFLRDGDFLQPMILIHRASVLRNFVGGHSIPFTMQYSSTLKEIRLTTEPKLQTWDISYLQPLRRTQLGSTNFQTVEPSVSFETHPSPSFYNFLHPHYYGNRCVFRNHQADLFVTM